MKFQLVIADSTEGQNVGAAFFKSNHRGHSCLLAQVPLIQNDHKGFLYGYNQWQMMLDLMMPHIGWHLSSVYQSNWSFKDETWCCRLYTAAITLCFSHTDSCRWRLTFLWECLGHYYSLNRPYCSWHCQNGDLRKCELVWTLTILVLSNVLIPA